MTENEKRFIEAYEKHSAIVRKPDVQAMAKDLGYTARSVSTLIGRYKRRGLIKDYVAK